MKTTIIALILFILSITLSAQESVTTPQPDGRSIDEVVNAMLEVISGEEGEVRDWDYFRSLFLPTARFTILYHPIDSMNLDYEMVNLDDFIEMMHDEYYDQGFTEYELGKVVNEYNGIANVFQSFYANDSEDEGGRGITSYQLVKFNNQWWIADVLWTTDSNGVEVPSQYLKP